MSSTEITYTESVVRRGVRRLLSHQGAQVSILLAFYVLILVAFSVLSPWFLSLGNMMSIGTNMAFIGLMAASATPLMIAGGLDLSVAAVAGLAGVVLALLHASGVPVVAGIAVAVLVGAAVGYFNGLVTMALKLNPFIVTLGMMSIVTGAALVLTGGLTKPILVPSFNWWGSGTLAGIPVPVLLLAAAYLGVFFLLSKTRFGRYVYAAGGNAEASRLIGIPVRRTLMTLYVASGISGALSGLLLAAMLGAGAPDAAGKHLLTVVAAVILGGTSLFGGRGNAWGTLLAVLILGTLNNGLTLMDVSSFWQDISRGVVLLLAVSLDQIRSRAGGE